MAVKTKKVKTMVKLQVRGAQANPAPPIGTALGPHGLNLQEFCKKFNELTKSTPGEVVPVEVTVFEDRTFTFILKTPPAAELLKKAAGVEKGSGKPLQEKVGTVTRHQVEEIAKKKMPDLNAKDLAGAVRIIEGTARQMGIEVQE